MSVVLILLCALPMVVASASAPVSPSGQDVDRFVESQMDKHRIPGVAVVLVEDGQVTYTTGYGTAGLSARRAHA